MQVATKTFREQAIEVLPLISEFAARQVPSSTLQHWASELSWPDEIFEGSTLEPSSPLPTYIRLDDDLLLIANLADLVGPEALLSSVAQGERVVSSAQAYARIISAPNAEAMLKHAGRIFALQYPYVGFTSSVDAKFINVEIAISRKFKLFGEFLEHMFAMATLHLCESFRPQIQGRSDIPSSVTCLRGGTRAWHKAFEKSGDWAIQSNSASTCIRIPTVWGRNQSVRHDPILWSEGQRRLAALQASSGSSVTLERLQGTLRIIIESEHRSPRLKEIAISEGLSERTLARRIASWGVTYQEIVDGIRAELATDHLKREHESIDSIARSLGFSHSASFARAFRHWYGCSPTDWRNGVMAN